MESPREDLRNELLSVIAAAPELEGENREHLADLFLDRLESGYQLVPRSEPAARGARAPSERGRRLLPFPLWPGLMAAFGLLFMLWIVTTSVFALAHPPVLLFVLLLILAIRFFRRRPHRYSPF